jgi:hypothetical protein
MMILAAGVAWTTKAEAHIDIASGPASANATNEVTFSVGHGCAGADTYRVVIDIPAGVTSVRPMRSDFGTPTIQKDLAGTITSVTWQKPLTEALDADIAFYKLIIRLKTPNQPFTTLYFASHQTCRAMDGTLTTVDWVGLPTTPMPDGGTIEPAAPLNLVPARLPGWNKYTVPSALANLSVFFKDALIVWKGAAAYSANPNTAAVIANTPGVTALTAISAGDEVWVKY